MLHLPISQLHHRRNEAIITVEGLFSLLKRGIMGTFHNVSKLHLHRYLAKFEFRYNTRRVDDGEWVALAIHGAEGKRFLYREPVSS